MNTFLFKNTYKNIYVANKKKFNVSVYNESKNLIRLNNVSKKKYITFFFKINKGFYHSYNFFNKMYINNVIKILEIVFLNNKNVLFIDSNLYFLLPVLNKIYGVKILKNENFFFLLKTKYITYSNWMYSYKSFLKKYDVNILFFMDYFKFNKFLNVFSKLNLPIIAALPFNSKNFYVDYYWYFSEHSKEFSKLVMYNYIYFLYFKNYNYNYFLLKKNFFNLFKKLKI